MVKMYGLVHALVQAGLSVPGLEPYSRIQTEQLAKFIFHTALKSFSFYSLLELSIS